MFDPYVYQGTNILINKANIKNQEELDKFENAMTTLAIIKLENDGMSITSVSSLLTIHKALFKNVYPFAGEIRSINIYKEEPIINGLSVNYCEYDKIQSSLKQFENDFFKIKRKELSKKDLSRLLTVYIAKLWQIHPFRKGNTRSVCLFMYFFMRSTGLKLNEQFIGEYAKFFRNALVMASLGEYAEYQHLEMILSDSISVKIIKNNSKKYETINKYNVNKYKYGYHHKAEEKK